MVCQQSVILVIPPWHKTLLNNRAAWSAARGDTRGQARATDQDVGDRGAADTSVRCAMRGRACEACAGSGVRALRDDTPPSLFSRKRFFSNIVYKCFTLSEPDPAVYQLPSRNEVRLEPFCAPLRKSKPRASESGMLKGYNGALLSAMHFCRRGSLLRQLDKLARLIARLQTTHEAMCKSRVWNLAKGLACIGSSEELERSCLCTTRAPMTMRDESLRTIFHVQSCSSSVRIPFQGDDA